MSKMFPDRQNNFFYFAVLPIVPEEDLNTPLKQYAFSLLQQEQQQLTNN